jgi:hypothetical protein
VTLAYGEGAGRTTLALAATNPVRPPATIEWE